MAGDESTPLNMQKINLSNGAIENVPDEIEKVYRQKHKNKKAADLSGVDIKELVYELAKRAGLI